MLCSRILFLLTYDTKIDFTKLFVDHDLAQHIHNVKSHFHLLRTIKLTKENIAFHAIEYSNPTTKEHIIDDRHSPSQSIDSRALTESLKLLFNLTQYYPDFAPRFHRTIRPIMTILENISLPNPVFQTPIISLVNALVNLDLAEEANVDSSALFPDSDSCRYVSRLLTILEDGLRLETDVNRLEIVVPPLILVLRRINEVAPSEVRDALQKKLLASDEERSRPLGKSDTLASHLLRLSNSPTAPQLKETILTLLFELSDKDAMVFIRNVSYGYAAGYLMSHQIGIPQAAGDAGFQATTVNGQEINPITGQRRDMEPTQDEQEMTDEEKEREAERLFVLFERLKATGVVNVVNPVHQAQQEGRFEEID